MAASQLALAERRLIVWFIPEEKERYRGYTYQLHCVVSNARIVIGHRCYELPELVAHLRNKHHSFCYYDILLSYFCHELVTADTHIHSPKDEVPIIDDIKVIGDHLRRLNIDYIHTHIRQTYTDDSTCTECIRQLTILYMKTTLEHRFVCLDSRQNFYHSERDHQFGEWVAKSLFNHDTLFSKTTTIHCYISHIVYASLLQETKFYSEAVKYFLAIEDELVLRLEKHPTTAETQRVEEATKKKKNTCAIDFILEYMGYNVDKSRKIYWVVAYLMICKAALTHNNAFNKKLTPSLLFYRARRKYYHPFYFRSAKTKELLFCSTTI